MVRELTFGGKKIRIHGKEEEAQMDQLWIPVSHFTARSTSNTSFPIFLLVLFVLHSLFLLSLSLCLGYGSENDKRRESMGELKGSQHETEEVTRIRSGIPFLNTSLRIT